MQTSERLEAIGKEMERAMTLFPTFNSTHEGWAVIFEEVDELWDHVRANKGVKGSPEMVKECIQIAAMALRFMEDLC
jgi:hypothetical protein